METFDEIKKRDESLEASLKFEDSRCVLCGTPLDEINSDKKEVKMSQAAGSETSCGQTKVYYRNISFHVPCCIRCKYESHEQEIDVRILRAILILTTFVACTFRFGMLLSKLFSKDPENGDDFACVCLGAILGTIPAAIVGLFVFSWIRPQYQKILLSNPKVALLYELGFRFGERGGKQVEQLPDSLGGEK